MLLYINKLKMFANKTEIPVLQGEKRAGGKSPFQSGGYFCLLLIFSLVSSVEVRMLSRTP